MSGFQKRSEREVYRGRQISVGIAEMAAPDGTTYEREIAHHPGAVSVVPVVDGGDGVLLVRQYRASVGRALLEIPAGKRDVVGEEPEATARRELIEEIGMRPGRLEKLAEFYNSPGFCDEHSFVFLGLDLEPTERSAQSPEEQHMTIERIALDDVPDMITSGQITDAKTIIGLCLARESLR